MIISNNKAPLFFHREMTWDRSFKPINNLTDLYIVSISKIFRTFTQFRQMILTISK